MKGDGFSPKVKEGDKVKKGDLLLEMDLDKIAAAAHPAVVITVVTTPMISRTSRSWPPAPWSRARI